eukprot:TRINITY_DN47241_c1_g1_i1.p2 TRINITY_DN47241_c1_g1~~TRINITY_DN47241_c1_g1_i1.p2  ORF type:complete len:109 (+),score=2.45 TRINITY_DN47241_c1_g1_i1:1044-1370(+)
MLILSANTTCTITREMQTALGIHSVQKTHLSRRNSGAAECGHQVRGATKRLDQEEDSCMAGQSTIPSRTWNSPTGCSYSHSTLLDGLQDLTGCRPKGRACVECRGTCP